MANIIQFEDIVHKKLLKVAIVFLSKTLLLFGCARQSQLTVLVSLDLSIIALREVMVLCRRAARRFRKETYIFLFILKTRTAWKKNNLLLFRKY